MVEAPHYLLIGAAVFFLGFMAVRAFWPLGKRAESAAARRELSRAVSEGTDAKRSSSDRAGSLVRAGRLALEDLGRPRLAARHAEWAHRLEPSDPAVIALLSVALVKARRLRTLERLLWVSADAEGTDHARHALIDLYDGPMKRPERARALRRWGGQRSSS